MNRRRLLPKMSSTVKALQQTLHAKSGFHMIYSESRRSFNTLEKGPVLPFEGMRISCLVYFPEDITHWCYRIGRESVLPAYEVGHRERGFYISTLRTVGKYDWTDDYSGIQDERPKKGDYAWFQMEVVDGTTVNGYYNNTMFKAHTGFTTNGISDDVYFHHEWTSYGDTMELHWTAAKPDLVPKLFLQTGHAYSSLLWLYSGGLVRVKCTSSPTVSFIMGSFVNTGNAPAFISNEFNALLAAIIGTTLIQVQVMPDHFILACEGGVIPMFPENYNPRATIQNTLSRAYFATQNAEILDVHIESGQKIA